jgi:phage terminase small subunit
MPVLKNAKHELFAQEVVKGRTLDAAYEIAGFKPHRANASRLRANDSISKRILELKKGIVRRVERSMAVSIERITDEFARIGFANITDVMAIRDGRVYVADTADMEENLTAAIAEIRQTKDGTVVKMHDKAGALVNLGKHLGYFKENIELNVTLSLADLVNSSYQSELPALPAPKTIEHEE